jgi:hypothetical protein
MPTSLTAAKLLDREFLIIRAKLIELAACLDRIQRGDCSDFRVNKNGTVPFALPIDDPRMDKITQAVQALAAQTPNRTEQIQILFSLPYDEHWQR